MIIRKGLDDGTIRKVIVRRGRCQVPGYIWVGDYVNVKKDERD